MSKPLCIITRETAIKRKLMDIICWPVRKNEFWLSIGFIVIWSLARSIDFYLLMASIKMSISITALALSSIGGLLLNVWCMLASAFIVSLISGGIAHFNAFSPKIAASRAILVLGSSSVYPVILMTADIIFFQSLYISGLALVLQKSLFAYYLFRELKCAYILVAFVIAEGFVFFVLQGTMIYCVSIFMQGVILFIKSMSVGL